MKYYVGKGTEFKKEECKEYKTLKNALAAAKDETLTVWDENGVVVGNLTDKVPEGALQTNSDGSVNTYDENREKTGAISAEEVAAITRETSTDNADKPQTGETGDGRGNEPHATENGQNGAENEPHEAAGDEGQQSEEETPQVIIPQGRMKVTVACDGTLNLRRTPAWGNGNICGRASRGQSYYVKAIHTVEGRKMVQTIDDVYLSGESDHVQFEQL